MIVDNMTKTEVMLSLKEEFKKEILPYYNNVLVERLKREVLPMVQRTEITQKKQFEKSTSGKNNFNLICTVKKRDYYLEAYCKFLWNNKTCFASFFDKESVVVYQKHCLERYAERVLGRKDMTPNCTWGQERCVNLGKNDKIQSIVTTCLAPCDAILDAFLFLNFIQFHSNFEYFSS